MDTIDIFFRRFAAVKEHNKRKNTKSTTMFSSANIFDTELSEQIMWAEDADDSCYTDECSFIDKIDDDDDISVP